MGKTSSTPYYGGSVSINGQNKASTYLQDGVVHSNYNMSDAEKSVYDYSQNQLAENLPKVNVFSRDTIKGLNNQINAYTRKGQDLINNTYTPMINNLKSDIASRFGNFDNSSFLNKLNSIENNRAEAVNSLAQDVMAKRNELYDNELANRYNYLNFMNNLQNQTTGNIMNYLNASSQNSSAGNSWGAANRGMSGSDYAQLAASLLSTAAKFI